MGGQPVGVKVTCADQSISTEVTSCVVTVTSTWPPSPAEGLACGGLTLVGSQAHDHLLDKVVCDDDHYPRNRLLWVDVADICSTPAGKEDPQVVSSDLRSSLKATF